MRTLTSPPQSGSSTTTAGPTEHVTTPTIRTDWTIREGNEGDHNLVLNSWLRSYRFGASWSFLGAAHHACRMCHAPAKAAQDVPEDVYYSDDGHQGVVKRSLAAGELLCVVDPEMPEVVYGWLVHEGPVLHYAYVKDAWRGRGVFRALLSRLPVAYVASHRTHDFERVLDRNRAATFNPYRMRR